MPTNEDRREVAERLRILATHKEVDKELVEDALGLYMGECIDGYDPVSVDDLADLIEPEPERTCHMTYDETEHGYRCSKCLSISGTVKRVDSKYYAPAYCSECGDKAS